MVLLLLGHGKEPLKTGNSNGKDEVDDCDGKELLIGQWQWQRGGESQKCI